MNNLPKHIAIIPDGNRRWAKERGMPTIEGHRRGFNNIIAIARKIRKIGIATLTIWAFSTENWQRTKSEVNHLMKLYTVMVNNYLKEAIKDNVRITHIGRKDRIPQSLFSAIQNAQEKTKDFNKYYLNVALDYGGRDEIVRAINRYQISKKYQNCKESDISQNLDLAYQPNPDPDLIIRTGKEFRLSGFMLWQSQYSELFFPEVYFPDFSSSHLAAILEEYDQRMRRFGK